MTVTTIEIAVQLLFCITLLGHPEYSKGCRTGDLRTVRGDDPSDNRRYPLYCFNGEWRRICAASFWKDNSAKVACRQLGYPGLITRGNGCPGSANEGKVRLSAICSGTEHKIQDCEHGIVSHNCDCNNLAWLNCQTVCTDGEIRLIGGSTNREGRVEVCMDGRWGTVCNNSQQLPGAVCSQLGFLPEGVTTMSTSTVESLPIGRCTVQAGGILSCSQITDTSCSHSMDLGVVCQTECEQRLNELQDQCSSTDLPVTCPTCEDRTCPIIKSESTPCPTCLPMTVTKSGYNNNTAGGTVVSSGANSSQTNCTPGSTTITAALGAVTVVLLVLLLGTVTALVVMCLKRRQALEPRNNVSSQNGDKASTDLSNVAVTNNPAYQAIEHDQMKESVYEDVNL